MDTGASCNVISEHDLRKTGYHFKRIKHITCFITGEQSTLTVPVTYGKLLPAAVGRGPTSPLDGGIFRYHLDMLQGGTMLQEALLRGQDQEAGFAVDGHVAGLNLSVSTQQKQLCTN